MVGIFTNRCGSSNLQLMLAARRAGALNNQDGFVNSSWCNAGEVLGLVCKILIAKAAGGTQLRHGALTFHADRWGGMDSLKRSIGTACCNANHSVGPYFFEAMPEIWYRGLANTASPTHPCSDVGRQTHSAVKLYRILIPKVAGEIRYSVAHEQSQMDCAKSVGETML
jgi:hypothetical protein